MNDEQKINILLSALEERYRSIHIIRERVQNICLWLLGIFLAVSGWVIQSTIILTTPQKIIYIVGTLVAFYVLRFLYLTDLNRGFKTQQIVATRIEKKLQLFKPVAFDGSEEPIYPENWKKSGGKDGEGKFFNSTYVLLYVGVTILVASILLKGCLF